MSGGIEEPYSIASLPKPLDAEHGRIFAANVYSISGSKKRKRREVAVGVDGEGVNIYNVQSQRTASSYALPPQSYLAAAPCSIYCKRAKPLQPQRQTYIAVRDGRIGHKARLVSITEELGKPQSEEREPRAPARHERKLREGDICSVDIVSSGDGNNGHSSNRSILVSYTNGNVDCIAGDLSATRWEHPKPDGSNLEVEYTAVVDLDTARKGLLKSREDVLAILDATSQGPVDRAALPLLVQVIRSDSRRMIRVHAVRNTHGQTLQTHRSSLEEVLSYELPFRQRYGSDAAHYELHAGTGLLYQRLGNRLTVVDLSGTTPKLSFELGRKGFPIVSSFIRLSAATVLVVSPGKLGVYETKYGSLLSALDLEGAGQNQPAETNDASTKATGLSIIAQFSDVSIVVGLSGNSLVAWQVGDMLDDGKRAKAHGPLLLEVMGKGKVAHETFGMSQKQEKKKRKWEEWTSKVDQLVSDSDIEAIEDLIAKDLHLNITAEPASANGQANGHANGHGKTETDEWTLLPHSFDPQYVNGGKATYLLGKIFRWRSTGTQAEQSEYSLECVFVSRNISRWLAMAGYLTASEIQLALSDTTCGLSRPQIAPGDIMTAIAEAESSMKLMGELIGIPVHWPLDEVIRGLQIVIRTLDIQDTSSTNEPLKAITNGDVMMADGDVESELAATVKQLDDVQALMESLESGFAVRNEVCRLFLDRLQAFPHKEVVRTMKRMMTDDDIIRLILILRVQLLKGGWLHKYVEQSSDDDEGPTDVGDAQDIAPSNQAIRNIANLCSCALDAIGVSGWLVGRSADVEHTYEFVTHLQNEISVALEGLFQAHMLDTLLGDLKRAASTVKPLRKRKRQDEEAQPSPEQTWMPVGGRAEPPVVREWKSKTGMKTKAAMAEEKSRQVGKYSFERIRI